MIKTVHAKFRIHHMKGNRRQSTLKRNYNQPKIQWTINMQIKFIKIKIPTNLHVDLNYTKHTYTISTRKGGTFTRLTLGARARGLPGAQGQFLSRGGQSRLRCGPRSSP